MGRRIVSLLACALAGALACGAQAPEAPSQATPGGDADVETPKPAPANPREQPVDGPPRTVLLELFTSQGCNSCPPADAFVAELAALGWTRDRVVPLTFHVTYWDDLGWRDPFGDPLHDQRQIAYATRVAGARADDETTMRGPYTPQMVVDGRVHFSGSLRDVALAELERARARPALVDIAASAGLRGAGSQARVVVDVESQAVPGAGLDTDRAKVGIFAALALREADTEVPRGENAGKKLTEAAVVLEFAGPKLFRSARPRNDTRFELTAPAYTVVDELEVAVIVQELATLEILAARSLPVTAEDAV